MSSNAIYSLLIPKNTKRVLLTAVTQPYTAYYGTYWPSRVYLTINETVCYSFGLIGRDDQQGSVVDLDITPYFRDGQYIKPGLYTLQFFPTPTGSNPDGYGFICVSHKIISMNVDEINYANMELW